MYYLKTIKKMFTVIIISSSILFFMLSNVVYSVHKSGHVANDNKLGKLLRNIEKRLPVLEKQVKTFVKIMAKEKHREKILQDFKQFGSENKNRETWDNTKLKDMYVYKVFKKLKIPMETMLICPKDLWWYSDEYGNNITPMNLMNPLTLSTLVSGQENHASRGGFILEDGILNKSKNIDKLNEIVETLKALQQIQYDALNENVEDEITFPQFSYSDLYHLGEHPQETLGGHSRSDCSKRNIKKRAKTKGSGQSILYLNMSNNTCFRALMFKSRFDLPDNQWPGKWDSVVEKTPKNYLMITSNLLSWYEEIGIPLCEDDWRSIKSLSDIAEKINKFIVNNYEEEEEIDISDLDAEDKKEESGDDELDLDDLKLDSD